MLTHNIKMETSLERINGTFRKACDANSPISEVYMQIILIWVSMELDFSKIANSAPRLVNNWDSARGIAL
jgi:hypothetical protein